MSSKLIFIKFPFITKEKQQPNFRALTLFYDGISGTSHHKKPCALLPSHGQSKYMSALIQLIVTTLKPIADLLIHQ
ncbi:hypothetical protein [Cytobacillus stercorigallinarum]|uniref:hypothetical protein n=1 Tax=Cytobacillus stercorigallinarum TaxID=2762240 RepID=UPI001CD8B8C7|nr:hypothetical protein [Cytobacillus stercorigallinarum]